MEGINCPICRKSSEWLSTTNEWEYNCTKHGRFNKKGVFMAKEGKDDLVVKMGQMTVVAKVIKKKFQHLTTEETIKLAGEILIALEEHHDV